jgi:hypothetical protein
VRVIAFIATTGNNNFSLVCSFSLGVTKYVYGTPITDWVDYTPSWTSDGTQPNIGNGSVTGKWRRVGDSIECQVRVLAGSTTTYGTGTYLLSLPQGLSFDTSKFVDGGDDQRLGYGSIVDQGNNRWFFFVNYEFNSLNKVKFIVSPDSTSGYVASNQVWTPTIPFTFGNVDRMAAFFSGPIQGWSSSVKMSDGYDGRDIVCRAYRNTDQSVNTNANAVKVQFSHVEIDTTNSFDVSNNRWICPSAGYYRINANLRLSGSNVLNNFYAVGILINNVIRSQGLATPFAGLRQDLICNDVFYLKAGDVVEINVYGAGNNSSNAYFLEGGLHRTYVSIFKVQSPQTIAMGEVVAARYSTASGQSIPINTYTTVNFNIKDYDTHNAVTTGTNWVFTAPVAGIYNVSFRLLYNFFSVSAPLDMPTALYKNNNYFCEIGRMTIPTGGNVYPSMGGSADIQLNAGDTISIRANNFTGAARNLLTDSSLVWVAIHKIS